jgi:hypothetical protein
VGEKRHLSRRRRRRVDAGKLIWLAEQATGPLADALDRDLRTDRLALDDLGWRGLWAYITAAPPGTAIYYARTEGWTIGDKLAANQLYATEELAWRYRARNFKDATKIPFPELFPYPGSHRSEAAEMAKSWATADPEDLMSPEVRAMIKGG